MHAWVEAAGRWSLYIYAAVIGVTVLGLVIRIALARRSAGGPLQRDASGDVVPLAGARPTPDGASAAPHRSGANAEPHRPGATLARYVLEYVGNVGPETPGPRSATADRRRNRQARVLMDHIKHDLVEREIPPSEAETLVQELRETLRTEEREPAG